MSDDLTCPTCGSNSVPLSVKAAVAEAEQLPERSREALFGGLETMYLYTEASKEPHWEKTMRRIIGHISPRTEAAIDDVGADAVWRFMKARFRR